MKGSSLSRREEGHIPEWDTAGLKFPKELGKIEPDLSLHSPLLVLTPLQPSHACAQALPPSTGQLSHRGSVQSASVLHMLQLC